MKRSHKDLIIYFAMLLIFGGLIYFAIIGGESFETISHNSVQKVEDAFSTFCNVIVDNIYHSFSIFLIQIIVVLIFVRLFSILFNYIGQPNVIGEIVAGIILGPSVLGALFPNIFGFIFREDSLKNLELVSQLGLVLFMFVIGMEVNFKVLKNKIHQTLVISHAGILVPFLSGIVVSYIIYNQYAASLTPFLPFALFIGISMSITAFPILARIIQERNMTKKPVGILAIASAANDDVTAWCLLAIVIAITKAGTFASALYVVLMTVIYIIVMFMVVRPFLKRIGKAYSNKEVINKSFVGFIFIILVVSSAFTEILGIHALFGAFVAGVIMPPNFGFRKVMMEKVEDIALVFFLPLFFAFTGLRTQINLINSFDLFLVCLLLIVVAVFGKFGGCSIAARIVGESWRDSFVIGTLMNTRGLMELVALNIGYELGVLPPPIFVILVLMALITTLMTTPMLDVIDNIYKLKRKDGTRQELLLLFGRPFSGPRLLYVCYMIFGDNLKKHRLVAVHYTVGSNLNYISTKQYSREGFKPIDNLASHIGVSVEKIYRVTDNLHADILKMVKQEDPTMVIIGSSSNIMKEQRYRLLGLFGLFKNRVDEIIKKVSCPIGILINHQDYRGKRLAALILGKSDKYVFPLIEQIVGKVGKELCIYYVHSKYETIDEIKDLQKRYSENVNLVILNSINELKCDSDIGLIIIGYNTCRRIMINIDLFNSLPSVLMIKGDMFNQK